MRRVDPHRTSPHTFSQPGEFFDGFAFQFKRDQRRCDLCVSGITIEQSIQELGCFNARQMLAANQTRQEQAKALQILIGCNWQLYITTESQRSHGDSQSKLCGPLCFLCASVVNSFPTEDSVLTCLHKFTAPKNSPTTSSLQWSLSIRDEIARPQLSVRDDANP